MVDKRILIEGEGLLGEARLDQRANSPGLRLRRSCWLRNLDLDMTGFREAVRIEGGPAVQPLLSSCILRYLLLAWHQRANTDGALLFEARAGQGGSWAQPRLRWWRQCCPA